MDALQMIKRQAGAVASKIDARQLASFIDARAGSRVALAMLF